MTENIDQNKIDKYEEENYYLVEELDEIDNPLDLELNDNESNDTIVQWRKRSWKKEETKEMLKLFKENKQYIDQMRLKKHKYEFIAKKLNAQNIYQEPIGAATVEIKIKSLIRSYRLNRGRRHVYKTDFDRDLEEIFDIKGLLRPCDVIKRGENAMWMEPPNNEVNSSEDEIDSLHYSNRIKSSWALPEIRNILSVFKDQRCHIDKLRILKDKYEFIAKKLMERNPNNLFNAATIESKIGRLIRIYRANRNRGMPKTDIERQLEDFFGPNRLLKQTNVNIEQTDVKSEVFKFNNSNDDYVDGCAFSNDNSSSLKVTTTSNTSEMLRASGNLDSETPRFKFQAQATQTALCDNMIIQLVQIEKKQQQRWQEEKAFYSRLERAKSERFARKELLLRELINVLKSKTQ